MIINKKIFNQILQSQLGISILLGLLSIVLGEIKFQIPGVAGGTSDLREIPLFISIFYLHNPVYFIVESAITVLSIGVDGFHATTFVMHAFTLVVGSFFYQNILIKVSGSLKIGVSWLLFTAILYVFFLVPTMMISDQFFGINDYQNPWANYLEFVVIVRFELITTGLVTSLFLVQLNIRQSLVEHQHELEEQVDQRTSQLALANYNLMSVNKELLSSNHAVKALNENLDDMVRERTEKIRIQLDQLIKFAHMNSHEVRAPLSRILGLIPIIRAEQDPKSQLEMMSALENSSNELDEIIKSMNIMLESEVMNKEG